VDVPVPFLDVAAAVRELRPEIDAALDRVLSAGHFVLGSEVEAFEQEFAGYVGANHCVGVNSGLDALTLGLRALGVGPGDDALVPSNTFVATWLAVSACGARPVPVEPDPRTFTLDPELLEQVLTPRTKVVLPVHLYGQPADMESVLAFARSHGLVVLDDAAQAHGARRGDSRIGATADATAWSFYPGKNLGALGDAGAVTTAHADVAQRLRLLRNYGSASKYVHDVKGTNSRLDEVQAAVLRVKLPRVDGWNERRAAVATTYDEAFSDLPLTLPQVDPGGTPVWHLYVVRHPHRDDLQAELTRQGVATLVHYPVPPHRQGAYADLDLGALELAERLAGEVLSLPIGPHLSEDQIAETVQAVRTATLRVEQRR